MSETTPPEVVVAGAGLAGLELVLALRDLARDRVRITLIAPEPEFVPRPMLVAEPLGAAPVQRRRLADIAADVGVELVSAAVASVDAAGRRVVLDNGGRVGFEVLVLAPGVQQAPAFDDVIHIGDEGATHALEQLRAEISDGAVSSVAFVAPTPTGWLLPLYEAALLTAAIDERVLVSVVTAEEQPLALFGPEASAAVKDELIVAGVEFVGGRQPTVTDGAVVSGDGGARIDVDRIVSLPLLRGPRIAGVPATGHSDLIPVDGYGRITGLDGVYAVGDATDFPIKQGGLACQQADATAAHIAAHYGADVRPQPFRPKLRARLITGRGESIWLGNGREEPGKLPGQYLAPYVATAMAV